MNKKKIVFFGAGKFQKKIIKIIKKKFFVITIDANKKAESVKYSNFFLNYKFNEIDKIFTHLKSKNIIPSNIISLNSDAGFLAAEKLKKKFHLKTINKNTIKIFFDKLFLLKFLKKNKFPVSNFSLNSKKIKKNFFIKPRKSSGSRDIIFIKKNLFNKNIKNNNKKFIFHEKVDGQEYVIDGLIDNGKIVNYIISKKIKFKNNKSVSQIIYTDIKIINNELKKKCISVIQKFLTKSQYSYGIFHIEFIINKKSFFIIDVAPRGPGFFVLEDYVLKHLGNKNIINIINLSKLIFKKKNEKYNSMLVYFLPTSNGLFKKIILKKKIKNYKFQKFINYNSLTSSVNADKDRIGSFTIYNKSKIYILKEINKIKKNIKILYS